MGEITSVPPLVEVSVPLSIEGVEGSVLARVHFFEGLVEEVVQFVAAVVVAASFTWAGGRRWWDFIADVIDWIIGFSTNNAAIVC